MSTAGPAHALLGEHAGEIRRRIDELEAALAAGDGEGTLRRAHMLKGSALALSLTDLAGAMQRLEAACRDEPPREEAAREALVAARAAAETALARQDAVARLAHALRTPLNVVLGFAHLLRDSGLDPAAREHAEAIVQAAEEMVGLLGEATGTRRSAADGAPANGGAGAGAEPLTVLCVEDDAASARLTEELLGRLPAVRVVVAATGAEGVAAAERERPGLVLLDLGLPDMPGDDVLRLIREGATGEVPVVVVVTGDSRPERLSELREAGASECVVKPVGLDRLQALVESVRRPV